MLRLFLLGLGGWFVAAPIRRASRPMIDKLYPYAVVIAIILCLFHIKEIMAILAQP